MKKIRYEAVSNVGLVRTNNEDMALVFGEYIRDNNIAFAFDLTPHEPFCVRRACMPDM